LLRGAIRQNELDAESMVRAGQFLLKEMGATAATRRKPWRVHLLGQCTTSWLLPALVSIAFGDDTPIEVSEGGYDTILQDLMSLPADDAPDAIGIVPWSSRLLESPGMPEEKLAAEYSFCSEAWNLVTQRLGSRLLQVGYDWVHAGPLGYCVAGQTGGPLDLVRKINEMIRRDLPRQAFFVDLEAISGDFGRSRFYDGRRYHWTKQPFSEDGAVFLAQHLWAGFRALLTGPKKVLVLDLDNTVWGGIVGETGPHEIAIRESADGEAFRAFQKYAKGLAQRGIVLAVASKNNMADAIEPFEKNPDMVLRIDDIAAWEVNWEPKGTTIARLASTLNLGLDSFVFFDDNPAEREQVRQALPDVSVVNVPEEPAEYIGSLERSLFFEAVRLTNEDSERAAQYAVERERRKLQESHSNLDDYLRSLEMVGDVRPIDDADLARVVQLLGKTNQFNVTTRRHTQDEVLSLINSPNSVHMSLRVRDRFGDHGLIGVLIGVAHETDPAALRIDTCLMSCRVIQRTVEEFLFHRLVVRARDLGYTRIIGEYIPTKKNALVAELYPKMGFTLLEPTNGSDVHLYDLDLESCALPATFLTPADGQ
jgi:FkbH-like protein